MDCVICGLGMGDSYLKVSVRGVGDFEPIDREEALCATCYQMTLRLECDDNVGHECLRSREPEEPVTRND